jgi:hypothetical protein
MWVDFTLRDVASTKPEKGDGVAIDPDNLAHGKPTVSSDVESNGFEAGMAVDSDETTRWSSMDEDPAWLYIDFGRTVDIERVEFVWEASYSKEYNIDVSDDAKDWKTVHEERNSKGGLEKIELKDINGRYIRMFGLKRFFQRKEYGHSLWEFRVYGK